MTLRMQKAVSNDGVISMGQLRLLLASGTIFALAACATANRPNFEAMSEDELFLYNQERPVMQRVYCFVGFHTSSRIRRKNCMTVADYVNANQQAADTLQVTQPAGAGLPRARGF